MYDGRPDARARALVDVTDPTRTVIVRMNLPAEISVLALGLADGTDFDPTGMADEETVAESSANHRLLVAGGIDEYETYCSITDPRGATVNLQVTVRRGEGSDPDREYLDVAWREIGMPLPNDPERDEEVLDAAQLITSGDLADAPIGVALIDVRTTAYVAVNHAYAAMLGYARRDLVGRSTEVGRPADAPLVEDAGAVLSVVRGEVDSITLTLPVPGESAIVQTATLHAIGERDRNTGYLLFYLLQRVQTQEDPAPARPLISTPLPEGAYSRATIDADWRLRFIEPPLVALGVERELSDMLSVLPSIHPADIPSVLAAADLVRSGRAERTVVRARYRVLTPTPGYLRSECEIHREPSLPEGWLILTNRLVADGAGRASMADRLRALTVGALAEDDGARPGSRSAAATASSAAVEFGLTPRETEILTLLVDGQRVTTIAKTLHLSDGTIRNYLSAIFQKVGVRSQAELLERIRRHADRA
jgi:DNA-binding CsgD family transcriptional regulator/PAS domain-containing protein